MADVGRPSEMSEEKVKKLEEAFAIDCTIEEACFYADISRPTYYSWIEKNPYLLTRFEALRNRPVLKARQTMTKALDNPADAKWYLEKKRKKEFGTAVDITSDGEKLQALDTDKVVKELTAKLNELYGKTGFISHGGIASPLGTETPDKE